MSVLIFLVVGQHLPLKNEPWGERRRCALFLLAGGNGSL
jgi:hypothetical protein